MPVIGACSQLVLCLSPLGSYLSAAELLFYEPAAQAWRWRNGKMRACLSPCSQIRQAFFDYQHEDHGEDRKERRRRPPRLQRPNEEAKNTSQAMAERRSVQAEAALATRSSTRAGRCDLGGACSCPAGYLSAEEGSAAGNDPGGPEPNWYGLDCYEYNLISYGHGQT